MPTLSSAIPRLLGLTALLLVAARIARRRPPELPSAATLELLPRYRPASLARNAARDELAGFAGIGARPDFTDRKPADRRASEDRRQPGGTPPRAKPSRDPARATFRPQVYEGGTQVNPPSWRKTQ